MNSNKKQPLIFSYSYEIYGCQAGIAAVYWTKSGYNQKISAVRLRPERIFERYKKINKNQKNVATTSNIWYKSKIYSPIAQ